MITIAVVRLSPINKDGDGADLVSVWFQMEVLQESKMMILDSHRRLVVAHGNLLQLLVSNTELSNSVKNLFHVTTGQNCVDETLNPHYRHMVANGFHEIGQSFC